MSAAVLRLYLAGPITGYPKHRASFERAKAVVALAGHEAISPLDLFAGSDWSQAMSKDLPALLAADGIVLLPGWPQSKGARLELLLASEAGKRVFVIVGGGLHEHTRPADGAEDLTGGRGRIHRPAAQSATTGK